MFCSKCGKELSPDEKFCSVCGEPASTATNNQDPVKVNIGSPFLDNWKTQGGMTALGIILLFLTSFLMQVPSITVLFSIVYMLIQIGGIIYAGAFYPKYFSSTETITRTNGSVSFLNGFFGDYFLVAYGILTSQINTKVFRILCIL